LEAIKDKYGGLLLMEEELLKELENLREENKILRDSLVEVRTDGQPEGDDKLKSLVQEFNGMLHSTLEKAKETLGPGTDKLTETLSRQMAENPVPLLLAAFGVGFLTGHGLNHK